MSSRFLDWFDRAWRWWTVLTAIILIGGVCFIVFFSVKQSEKDRAFVRARLLPVAHFVQTFREARGRLPTQAEFTGWANNAQEGSAMEYYPQKPAAFSSWGTPGRDFVVGVSRGEWMHYYQSWDGKDFAGEMAPLRASTPTPHH